MYDLHLVKNSVLIRNNFNYEHQIAVAASLPILGLCVQPMPFWTNFAQNAVHSFYYLLIQGYMRIAFLPNAFKKIGLVFLSLVAGYEDFKRGFWDGYHFDNPGVVKYGPVPDKAVTRWADGMLFAGMLVYMLSREKVEDEYLSQQRAEAFSLAFVATVAAAFSLYLLNVRLLKTEWLLLLQLAVFLVVFYFKKRAEA